ncbi:MAG: hypothetical protein U5R31_15065 [Acidimicrobiia bacterium]|nr:hypothetical protein [Acidimicrobiia bacterium]
MGEEDGDDRGALAVVLAACGDGDGDGSGSPDLSGGDQELAEAMGAAMYAEAQADGTDADVQVR